MSAITSEDILQASIESNVLYNQAITADIKKNESLGTLTSQEVAGALLTVDSQIDVIQTQIDYLLQAGSETDTGNNLQDT